MIHLRTPKSQDIDLLFQWENDPQVQTFSYNQCQYTKEEITIFVESARRDNLVEAGQQRFMIEVDSRAVGCVDLYDFDSERRTAGVGILIYDPADRRKGYAVEALRELARYAEMVYHMRELWAEVPLCNEGSCKLFSHAGYSAPDPTNPTIYRLSLD